MIGLVDRGQRFEVRYRNYKGHDALFGRCDSRLVAERWLRAILADPCREDQRIIDRQQSLFPEKEEPHGIPTTDTVGPLAPGE